MNKLITVFAFMLTALLLSASPVLCDFADTPQSDDEWRVCLRGSWHDSMAVGSGWGERYVFTSEDCAFVRSQFQSEYWGRYNPTARYSYDVIDGELVLDSSGVVTKLSLEWGGIDDTDSARYDSAIPNMASIRVGGDIFYRFTDEPDLWFIGETADLAEYGFALVGETLEFERPDRELRIAKSDEDRAEIDGFPEAEWERMLLGSWMPSAIYGYDGIERAYIGERGIVLLPAYEGGEVFIGYWELRNGAIGLYGDEADRYYVMMIPIGGFIDDDPTETGVWFDWNVMRKYSDQIVNDVPPEIASRIDSELYKSIFSESVDSADADYTFVITAPVDPY